MVGIVTLSCVYTVTISRGYRHHRKNTGKFAIIRVEFGCPVFKIVQRENYFLSSELENKMYK